MIYSIAVIIINIYLVRGGGGEAERRTESRKNAKWSVLIPVFFYSPFFAGLQPVHPIKYFFLKLGTFFCFGYLLFGV